MSAGEPVVIARRGVGGYRQYRIPAMTVTATGRVLVAYDGRPDIDDLPAPVDILLRSSDDSGRTWSEQRVLRTGSGFAGFGDASLLVDAHTGRIFLMHQATQLAGFFESSTGTADDDPHVQHTDLAYSDDDGETWTVRRITRQLKRPGIEGLFAASGQGAQIFAGPYAGRLLQPYVLRRGDLISAAVAYSDDHGQTWTLGEEIGRGTNESKAVPLSDGTVLVNSRCTPHRMVALSRDGGATFGGLCPDTALPDPSDNGSAIRLDGRPVLATFPDQPHALLCAHNHDIDLRRNLLIKYSPDDGATWTKRFVVCPGSAAYSVLCRLPDGDIGVLYEREGYSQLEFRRVSLDQFMANADEPVTDPLSFDMVLRFVRSARPEASDDLGDSHVIPLDDAANWSVAEWREIGQAHTSDTVQRLYSRQALDAHLGPVRQGLSPGDELRFTGRIRNDGKSSFIRVRLSGSFDEAGESGPFDLAPGQRQVFRAVRRFVSEADVEQGAVQVDFHATAIVDGERLVRSIHRRYSTRTGLPIEPSPG